MFKHFNNKMLEKEDDVVLDSADIDQFKKNQASSWKQHKRLTKFEVATKLKIKQKK